MKKYVKPTLAYESFVLSQNVALCDYQINSGDASSCRIITDRRFDGLAVGGYIATPVCDFSYEDYCYTNGSGSTGSTFQS